MAKVRCKFCEYEDNNKCIKKKSTVKLNKKRVCSFYKGNEEKIAQEKVKVSKVRTVVKSAATLKSGIDLSQFNTTADMKHPLTGDLSKFVKEAQ